MNFHFPSPEKDANSEKPTIENINAGLNQRPTKDGVVIFVTELTPNGRDLTVQTLKRKVGSNEFVEGKTVESEESLKSQKASSIAEKIRTAYGIKVVERSED